MEERNRKSYLAFAILATIGFGLLQAARFVDLNSGPYSSEAFAFLGLFVDGVSLIAVAMLSYFGKVDDPKPIFVIGIASTIAYLLLSAFVAPNVITLSIRQVLSGLMWAGNILCWMHVLTACRPKHALVMIVVAYGINVAVGPIAALLGIPNVALLFTVSLASVAMLGICLKHISVFAGFFDEGISPVELLSSATTLEEVYSRTRRAVVGAVVFSAVCGFVIQSDLMATGIVYAQTGMTSAICLAMAAVMLAVLLAFKVEKANMDYIWPVAAAWIAIGLSLRYAGAMENAIAGSFMTATLISFYVLLWLMLVSEAHERKLPGFFLLGLALGASRLSVLAGRAIAIGLPWMDYATYFPWLLLVLIIALSAVFFAYLRYSSKRWSGEFKTAEEIEDASGFAVDRAEEAASEKLKRINMSEETLRAEAIDALVHRCGLSKREAQMVDEFAAGRSARYIAEWYMLSEHTVKTHLRHAYAKIGVHTRQELLDAIEAAEGDELRALNK